MLTHDNGITQTVMGAALRQAAVLDKSPLNYRGAIVQSKASFEKTVAFALIQLYSAETLTWVDMWTKSNCPDEQLEEWKLKRICPIDVGPLRYTVAKANSATEWAVQHMLIPFTPAVQYLVALMNSHKQGGCLLGDRNGVPDLLPEFYELDKEKWQHVRTFTAAVDVATAYIRALRGDSTNGKFGPEEGREKAHELSLKFGGAVGSNPFTLGRYVLNLWMLGYSIEEITEKLDFWRQGLMRLEKERQRANATLRVMELKEFTFRGLSCVVLPDDYFLSRAAARKKSYDVRVIRGTRGHTVITTRGLNVRKLHRELDSCEPGRWKMNNIGTAVVNGGVQAPDDEPTSLTVEQVRIMVQRHVFPKDERRHQS